MTALVHHWLRPCVDADFDDIDHSDLDYVLLRHHIAHERELPLICMDINSIHPLPSLQTLPSDKYGTAWDDKLKRCVVCWPRAAPYTPPIRRQPVTTSPDYDVTTIPYEPDAWKPYREYIKHDAQGRYIDWEGVPADVQAEIDAYIERRYGRQ